MSVESEVRANTEHPYSGVKFDLRELYTRYHGRQQEVPADLYPLRLAAEGRSFAEIDTYFPRSLVFRVRVFETCKVSPKEAVGLLYSSVLNRLPDQEGVSTYSSQIREGRNVDELIDIFASSDEYRAARITQLYQELLERDSDEGGIDAYLDQLKAGTNIFDIAGKIKSSDEYNNLPKTGAPKIVYGSSSVLEVLGKAFLANSVTEEPTVTEQARTQDELNQLVAEKIKAESDAAKEREARGTAEATATMRNTQFEGLLEHYTKLKNQLDNLQREVETTYKARVATLEADNRAQAISLDAQRQEVKRLTAENTKLKDDGKSLRTTIDRRDATVLELQSTVRTQLHAIQTQQRTIESQQRTITALRRGQPAPEVRGFEDPIDMLLHLCGYTRLQLQRLPEAQRTEVVSGLRKAVSFIIHPNGGKFPNEQLLKKFNDFLDKSDPRHQNGSQRR